MEAAFEETSALVSELDRYLPPVGAASRRESPSRDAASAPDAMARDADVRVTLSAASRRLSERPDAAADPAETPDSSPLDAYREPARPALGERLSIRV